VGTNIWYNVPLVNISANECFNEEESLIMRVSLAALALLLPGVQALPIVRAQGYGVYDRFARFPVSAVSERVTDVPLAAEEDAQEWMRDCPCVKWHPEAAASRLCLPVAWASPEMRGASKKEVFAFSIASDDRWKRYDWDLVRRMRRWKSCHEERAASRANGRVSAWQLTTVAWNTDPEMLCHAHDKGVLVVVKHNFDAVDQLCDLNARREWVQVRRMHCQ